ncbi:MAG TPA: hypothetical protein PLL06_16515, partial [Acidobacteriota bacterium]|nr:hypothetical protein [Acidobacteriota bacterium]
DRNTNRSSMPAMLERLVFLSGSTEVCRLQSDLMASFPGWSFYASTKSVVVFLAFVRRLWVVSVPEFDPETHSVRFDTCHCGFKICQSTG